MNPLLAILADLYTPGLIGLLLIGLRAQSRRPRTQVQCQGVSSVILLTSLMALLLWVYGLMALDRVWALWPRWSLDYSTHTAVALVLVWAVVKIIPSYRKRLWASLLLYGQLMVIMNYHTWQDILTTALAISAAIGVVEWRLFHRSRVKPLY